MMKAKLLYKCNDAIGEGATWLKKKKRILWVDITGCILHSYNPYVEDKFKEIHFPAKVSTIVPMDDGRILLTLQGSIVAYDIDSEYIETISPLFPGSINIRPNDGKASPDGRLWLGMMHLTDHKGTGSLMCFDKDLTPHEVLTNQNIPNGIVWTKDAGIMYYVDSGRGVIEAYDYDIKTGSIANGIIVVTIPPELGVPDGMTIDADGNLWVAHWGGFGVYIWNPDNGKCVGKVEVPVPNVASCTFGEDGLLYITTAREGLSKSELDKYPLSGSLFVAETNVVSGENHYTYLST